MSPKTPGHAVCAVTGGAVTAVPPPSPVRFHRSCCGLARTGVTDVSGAVCACDSAWVRLPRPSAPRFSPCLCGVPGALFLLRAEQPAPPSPPTSPGEGRARSPWSERASGSTLITMAAGASREGAAPRPRPGSRVTGSLCQQTGAGCVFCPTSALTGGGVRGILPPPPRSRGSLLPSTPQLLKGLSQRLWAGGRPQRLQETRARPACRHGNAGLAGASGWMIDVGGPAQVSHWEGWTPPIPPGLTLQGLDLGNPIVSPTRTPQGLESQPPAPPATFPDQEMLWRRLPQPRRGGCPPCGRGKVDRRRAQSCSPPARERHASRGLRRSVLGACSVLPPSLSFDVSPLP